MIAETVMPSVDVVLCTFNGAAFLAAQLRSLRDQTRPVDRVIVSDDGSTDATADVLRAFEGNLPLELARNETQLGVTANFESALRRARGDLIFLCDQDDVWHKQKVELLLAEAERHPDAMLLHSDARIVDASGADTGRRLFGELHLSSREWSFLGRSEPLPVLLRRNIVTGATSAIRRKLLDYALPIAEEYWHDEWLALIAAAMGPIYRISEPLIDYRIHGSNQAGLRLATPAAQLRAMSSRRGSYHAIKARKLDRLLQRLRGLNGRVSQDCMSLVEACHQHWQERATMPRRRFDRLPVVWQQLQSGSYRRFSSGWRSVVRDLAESLT